MGIMSVSSTEDKIQEDIKIGDTIADHTSDMAQVEDKIDKERLTVTLWAAVSEAITDPKDYQVIEDRYKHGCTLKECGEHLGVNGERARVRESKAMRQMRNNKRIKEIGEAEGIVKPTRSYKRNKRVSIDYGSMTDDEVFSMYEAMM